MGGMVLLNSLLLREGARNERWFYPISDTVFLS